MATKDLLVKYQNIMNEITLSSLKPSELNIFMYLIAKARDKGSRDLEIPFDVFLDMLDPKRQYLTSEKKVENACFELHQKILQKLYRYQDGPRGGSFVLINNLDYDFEKHTVTFQINDKFVDVLNKFGKQNPFTSFEFERFFKLETKHSKNLYRQLMQWKTKGEWTVKIDEFRFLFGLSEKYTARNIMAKIIEPSIAELLEKGYFSQLKCEPERHGRGGRVYGYYFRFAEAVNDKLPGQLSMFVDEEGRKHFRTKPDPKKDKRIHNYHEREYDFDELARERDLKGK